MSIVVVTGAGASRELGQSRPLPLMEGWCNTLCEALEDVEAGLAGASGLRPGMTSEDFEEALGALLRWQEMRPLNRRFSGLGGANVGKFPTEVQHAFQRETGRLQQIMATLNATLYREFGAQRISIDHAAGAYKWLLEMIGLEGHEGLPVFVTTNYDCSTEIALAELGYVPNSGFIRRPGLSPKLAPEGLVARVADIPNETAVLHLHGAVGWYQHEGDVVEHYADRPFDEAMGIPTVLYPDPEKDPTRDAAVQLLWDEFDHALESATHILVLGHSLHDKALLQRLSAAEAAIGFCVHEPENGDPDYSGVMKIADYLPHGIVIPTRFGPQPSIDHRHVSAWLEGRVSREKVGM